MFFDPTDALIQSFEALIQSFDERSQSIDPFAQPIVDVLRRCLPWSAAR